jgi:hypothetical protein
MPQNNGMLGYMNNGPTQQTNHHTHVFIQEHDLSKTAAFTFHWLNVAPALIICRSQLICIISKMQHGTCNYTVTAGTCPTIQQFYYVHDDIVPRIVKVIHTLKYNHNSYT